MPDLKWKIKRLKAMSAVEIVWRFDQKRLQTAEKHKFERRLPVTDHIFNRALEGLRIDPGLMHIQEDGCRALNDEEEPAIQDVLWNAGIQTKNDWPLEFCYDLEYKERDDIGDARTNWEINRHFQFSILARRYYAYRRQEDLERLTQLFNSYNEAASFLWGISWTSVMEVAIRANSWTMAYCFLRMAGVDGELTDRLNTGIINMADYIAKHYSRFSSANNHLVVEAFAIGQTGILTGNTEWTQLAIGILTEQLPLQNFGDGVNKEMSLHYQSFYMEVMALMMRLMAANGIEIPTLWLEYMEAMAGYIDDCRGEAGETAVFGDDDAGKILDLRGGEHDHYEYVLSMCSILLSEKYRNIDVDGDVNITALFSAKERLAAREKPERVPEQYAVRREGGCSIMRNRDRRILAALDHGQLGFGSIAAHGHADALSIVIFADGKKLITDPGTYLYHCAGELRDTMRTTACHSTVTLGDRDQSKMLGPFLWGERAECRLKDYTVKNGGVSVNAEHNGYKPFIHSRAVDFDGDRSFVIKDSFTSGAGKKKICFIIAPDLTCTINGTVATIEGNGIKATISGPAWQEPDEIPYSPEYGKLSCTQRLSAVTEENSITTEIKILI